VLLPWDLLLPSATSGSDKSTQVLDSLSHKIKATALVLWAFKMLLYTCCLIGVLARMRVPKMVKNGFNSGLPVSPVFEETKSPKKSRTDTKPKAVPRS